MDTIDKWLKSLRLHKYTHLFKSLTYDQMLNLEEQYLIDREVTKGARNKMLVSVKKLNLRQERLINMIDDLNQDNISMKEALTVLKDMLITPIPPPYPRPSSTSPSSPTSCLSSYSSSSAASTTSSASSTTSSASSPDSLASSSCASNASSRTTSPMAYNKTAINSIKLTTTATTGYKSTAQVTSTTATIHLEIANYLDPYDLTYLFTETLEKVAQLLIESFEDSACHGIMAAIVDECLKHNSFTREQKARVASFRQHFIKEQKAKLAGFKQHFIKEQKAKVAGFKNHLINEQKAKVAGFRQQLRQQRPLLHNSNQQQYQQQYHQQLQLQQQQQQQQQLMLHQFQQQQQLQHQQPKPQHHHHNHEYSHYREYSLLGPGITFELPCLRALAAKHSQLCFLRN